MNDQIQLGRAKNALLSFFENTLSVPKIYLDTEWAGQPVDVLAINRDGSGDVYAALMFTETRFDDGRLNIVDEADKVVALLEKLKSIPTHYKYIVAVDINPVGVDRFGLSPAVADRTFSPDGLGRVGFLTIQTSKDREPLVQVYQKPERFRAKVNPIVDAYIQEHAPDWELRA